MGKLVSVIMGTYNGEKKISEAIDSILNQTYCNIELLICDDGSKDNTYDKITNIAKYDDRIKILKNDVNKGLSYCLNRLISISEGFYIARMDDDDISLPERIEKQIAFLENNRGYSIVGTESILFDENGPWGKTELIEEPKKLDIFLGKTFIHPSVIMRKDHLIEVGGYSEDPKVGRSEDYDLWCRFYKKDFYGFNIKEKLINYYESRSNNKKRKFFYRIIDFKLRLKYRREFELSAYYDLFAFKTLLVGLMPIRLYTFLRRQKFKK